VSRLYLDIETIPPNLEPDELARLLVKAQPSNLRDPEKIRAWRAAHAELVWAKLALDWRHAVMVVCCFAIDDGPVQVVRADQDCTAHAANLAHWWGREPTVVGWNVAGFDLPLLWRWAVRAHAPFAGHIPHRRFDPDVCDLMQVWGGTTVERHWASQRDVVSFLGLRDTRGDTSGADVWKHWQNVPTGRDTVVAKCIQDVEDSRSIDRELNPPPRPDPNDPDTPF
jgi:hypothetical protein